MGEPIITTSNVGAGLSRPNLTLSSLTLPELNDKLDTISARIQRLDELGNVVGDVVCGGGLREHGRSQNSGTWIQIPFDATAFYGFGSLTWTVTATNVLDYSYSAIGNTAIVRFSIATSTLGGVVNNMLFIRLPFGQPSDTLVGFQTQVPVILLDSVAVTYIGRAIAVSGNNFIEIQKLDGSNFPLGNFTIFGQIALFLP